MRILTVIPSRLLSATRRQGHRAECYGVGLESADIRRTVSPLAPHAILFAPFRCILRGRGPRGGLAVHAPLFLRSPLGPDPVMYDLQARVVLNQGVLYQEILEPNLPGAVWIHAAVRSIAGWSPEALRAFDLIGFCLTAWLATRIVRGSAAMSLLLATLLISGYSTLSEWCHCQRDLWMLPFVLAAVVIRLQRLTPLPSDSASTTSGDSRLSMLAVVEGLLWGAAVWLKPHVVVPALCIVVASWRLSRSKPGLTGHLLLTSEAAVFTGGLFAGAVGVIWLIQTEAWPAFWSTLTEWNREYVAASANRWSLGRLWSIEERLAPWSLIHLAALPLALRAGASLLPGQSPQESRRALASALYLGWFAQALLLQHLFDYVHAPLLVLGTIVVATHLRVSFAADWTPTRFAVAAVLCLLPSLVVRGPQLKLWSHCLKETANSDLSSQLARLPLPDWASLERVADFLRQQAVQDGELTTYHTHTIHLLPKLAVGPATPFVFTETHLRLFPSRAKEISEALARSRQRYVVSSLIEAGLDPTRAQADDHPESWKLLCALRNRGRPFRLTSPSCFAPAPIWFMRSRGPSEP